LNTSYKISIRDKKSLNNEAIEIIQKILEASCNGEVCLRKAVIYEEVQKYVDVGMELYRFEQALTDALKSGKIAGFETRPGRAGGVCRCGAFSNRDKLRQSKRPKAPDTCYLTIGKATYKVPLSEQETENFVVKVLDGEETNSPDTNVIHVNTKPYHVPHLTAVSRIVHNYMDYIGSNLIEG
jgi:hypothetical protein